MTKNTPKYLAGAQRKDHDDYGEQHLPPRVDVDGWMLAIWVLLSVLAASGIIWAAIQIFAWIVVLL